MQQSATVRKTIEISGDGLFSGELCRATVRPATEGTGLVFVVRGQKIPATPDYLKDLPNCTALADGEYSVKVVEHMLAALWAAGIDTALIDIEGPECPNVDGSAQPIFAELRRAGLRHFSPRPVFHYPYKIRAESDSGAYIMLSSAKYLSVEYHFSHPELGKHVYLADLTRDYTKREILPARTFITEKEARHIRSEGILKHTNKKAALVVNPDEGEPPLRFGNEYARHKVLDIIGDLAVLPFEIEGKITARHSGHHLNRELARKIWQIWKDEYA